jgi:hypothetical protein
MFVFFIYFEAKYLIIAYSTYAYEKERITMKKFTERTYESEKQFNKVSRKLAKKGFKVLKTTIEDGQYLVEYQTKP